VARVLQIVHYNLACYASLAGNVECALTHLGRAFELDPATREWARDDADLAAVRKDSRYSAGGADTGDTQPPRSPT